MAFTTGSPSFYRRFETLPLVVSVEIMKNLDSLSDILNLSKASTRASVIISSQFSMIACHVFNHSVPSDFRQLIWAILDLQRPGRVKPKGAKLVELLHHLGDARYPSWPDWAPKSLQTVYQISTLIDNAGFFSNIQKACRDFNYHWYEPLARPYWANQTVTKPRHSSLSSPSDDQPSDLPYYIFELYCVLFHVEAGSVTSPFPYRHLARSKGKAGPSSSSSSSSAPSSQSSHQSQKKEEEHDERHRMWDHDNFLAFLAGGVNNNHRGIAPPSKFYPETKGKDAMARYHHSLWFFGFLFTVLSDWVGGAIIRTLGLHCLRNTRRNDDNNNNNTAGDAVPIATAEFVMTVSYNMSKGLAHIRKILRFGAPAESTLAWMYDSNFLPYIVAVMVCGERGLACRFGRDVIDDDDL